MSHVYLTCTVRMKSQKRKRKREFKTRRSGSGFLLNPGLRWLKQAILTAGALVSFGRWIVVFYLGFLPPDCLDTHGLCIMGQSEQRNNNQKALINTGGFLLYACIPLQMSVYIYIHTCTYTRNKRTLHCTLARAGKQKLLKLLTRRQMRKLLKLFKTWVFNSAFC